MLSGTYIAVRRRHPPIMLIRVVVADHGSSFRKGESLREITWRNLSDILCVPLLIKRPGQREGVVTDRNVETIDVLPTIMAELGVELPTPVDGQSAIDFTLDEPEGE